MVQRNTLLPLYLYQYNFLDKEYLHFSMKQCPRISLKFYIHKLLHIHVNHEIYIIMITIYILYIILKKFHFKAFDIFFIDKLCINPLIPQTKKRIICI